MAKPQIVVLVDTETGSTDIDKAGICQIAGVVLSDSGMINTLYSSYCKPSKKMEAKAVEVHGVTPEMYQWSPPEPWALAALSLYIEKLAETYEVFLGGHNVDRYDLPLMAGRYPAGVYDKLPTLDTLRLFRTEYPAADHKLGPFYEWYLGESAIDAHDAAADCWMCAKALWLYRQKTGASFGAIARRLERPQLWEFMPFGKYKNMALGTDVPRSYLQWMRTNFANPDPDLAYNIHYYLEEYGRERA